MTMLLGLLEKELRQHALAFGTMALFLVAGLLLVAGQLQWGRFMGGGIPALLPIMWSLFPLAAFTLAQALIASEFQQKTQLFLEALPLPLWRFIALKYVLGLMCLATLGAVLLAATVGRRWTQEAMDCQFLWVLSLKVTAWVLFLHALFFAHAFLGRYRWPATLLVLLGIILLATYHLKLQHFGPFRLLDIRFPYERRQVPMVDLLWTLSAAVALSALGFTLALARGATLAAWLAEPMSAREKGALVVLFIGCTMAIVHRVEQQEKIEPIELPGALITHRSGSTVNVAAAVERPTAAEAARLQEISTHTADELQAVGEYLGISPWPPVFIVHRRDFPAGRLEDGELKPSQGVMFRVNAMAPKFDAPALERELIRKLLRQRSRERLNLEPNSWLLDGFPHWWQARHGTVTPPPIEPRLLPLNLRRWHTVRKRTGEEPAKLLAATALQELASAAGPEATRRFLSATLSPTTQQNALGWWREQPWPRRLQTTTGLSEATFVQRWNAWLTTSTQAPRQP